jgi:hypothetical protein
MTTYMLWYGGSNYANPELADAEKFPSVAAALHAFRIRAEGRDSYYPCVESSSALIYASDPATMRDPYPDLRITMGPRGGVRKEVC